MRHITHTALAIAAVSLIMTPTGPSTAPKVTMDTPISAAAVLATGAEPVSVVIGGTYEDQRLADWALDRFAEAGLTLPALTIEFAADKTPCGGNTGLAIDSRPTSKVILCTKGAVEIVVKKALLHELAHIWSSIETSVQTREAFVAARAAGSWNDPSTPWFQRGNEMASEIVAWALLDREILLATLADHDPTGLADDYQLLTEHLVVER